MDYGRIMERVYEALRYAKAGINNEIVVRKKDDGETELSCGAKAIMGPGESPLPEISDKEAQSYILPIQCVISLVKRGKLRTAYIKLCRIIAEINKKVEDKEIKISSVAVRFLKDAQLCLLEGIAICKSESTH